jgi:hypothetical protein
MEYNKSDAYGMLKGLLDYLKTEVSVSKGDVEKNPGRSDKMLPGYIVRIKVSNEAPVEPIWPMVVFTGVSLAALHGGSSQWINRYKVDLSAAPQLENLPSPPDSFEEIRPVFRQKAPSGWVGDPAERFPIVTSDETKHGYFLFPGQSMIFEMGFAGEVCPNLKDLNVWVQGSLSRRHLFHSMRQIS